MGVLDPVFGDLQYEREMRENKIKGNLLGRRAWYVADRWGPAGLASVAAAVPDEARQHLTKTPLAFAWYPFGVMMDIDRAIVQGPMRGELSRMFEFGSAIAKHDLPTLYKVLFKLGSPGFIVKRLNIAARAYIGESTVTGNVDADGRGEVTLAGRRFPMYFCKYGVSGWFHAALELSGAREPRVSHDKCVHQSHPACSWQLTWR